LRQTPSYHSENRDAGALAQLRSRATAVDGFLAADPSDGRRLEALRVFGRDVERDAPDMSPWPEPSGRARNVAAHLLVGALERVAREQRATLLTHLCLGATPEGSRREWRVLAPKVSGAGVVAGLPLLTALCPDVLHYLARQRIAVALGQPSGGPQFHESDRRRFAQNASLALARERLLWEWGADPAAEDVGMPYLFRYLAIRAWWTPETHVAPRRSDTGATFKTSSVCLRCGDLVLLGRRTVKPPLCPHCSKEPPAVRTWPDHAVAPAKRGTWWLMCQRDGCDLAFYGRRDRRYCDQHVNSKLAPAKRSVRDVNRSNGG
jgi:hypothetical protein